MVKKRECDKVYGPNDELTGFVRDEPPNSIRDAVDAWLRVARSEDGSFTVWDGWWWEEATT